MPVVLINGIPTYVSSSDFNSNYVEDSRKHIDIESDGTWSGITDTQLDTIKIKRSGFQGHFRAVKRKH